MYEEEERQAPPELDACRLFHGHNMELGCLFRVAATNSRQSQSLTAELVELDDADLKQAFLPPFDQEPEFTSQGLVLKWKSEIAEESIAMPLTERGGLSFEIMRRRPPRKEEQRQSVAFVSTASLSSSEVISLLNRVVLNPEEELLLRALRIIEPEIERIAPVSGSRFNQPYTGQLSYRGGVVAKLRNLEKRLPIGTMGDGIWRLLALALSLVRAEGGVLLIDEIDTGLHYSVMEDMWRLVHETARRLDVQVFATSHSNDCWRALTAVSNREHRLDSEITVQRIERGQTQAKPFSESEIIIAAQRDFELR